MGVFDKLFQSKTIEIAAPVSGEIIPITDVNDPAFSEEVIGKGIAIMPSEGKFYAPADGNLVALFPTGHAFCVNTPDGVELMVHIGIDTVNLKGEFFTIHKKQGVDVKKGDLVVEVDLDSVRNAGYEVVTPLIIANHKKFSKLEKKTGAVAAGDAAILLTR